LGKLQLMRSHFFTLLLLVLTASVFAQKVEYSILTIPDSLKQNANAVVRLSKLDIDIGSQKAMTLKSVQVTTVLNELGLRNLNLMEHYDKNSRITKIEATAYDAFGKLLKAYKRKDFKDTSVADGVSIFNDNRALYLDYTPITYPFTMILEVEVETSNTAFIPSWSPMDGYLASTQKTMLTINYKPELKLKIKEVNLSSKFPIEKIETPSSITFSAKNLVAKKREELSPGFSDVFPTVYFALENFRLESVDGNATNWQEFGKWYYNALLADTEEIPEETQNKIKQLVGNEKNPLEIAKIIYKYVQEKTRYVSVQVGIGGWKPMLAKDVDKLGYGDCKALSNYTRSLLKVVGVPSYYTVVYAGADETKDLQDDFASIQGNHVILTLPVDKKLIWLECTSQIQPFGFQGDFTDDRNVLLIKPEGGEIVKTKVFAEADNLQKIKGDYQITENGDLIGNLKISSKGLRYDNEFQKERMSREDQIKQYKEQFDNINNLKIKKITLNNDPKTIDFTETLELEAESYAQNSGGKLMFALNAFDQSSYVPKKYKTREFSFQMERGYTNEEEIEITIPDGFVVEAKPEGITLDTEFGYYKIEFTAINASKIVCKRRLVIKKGIYDKSKYESYRKFRETLAKNDNSKIVITKT
jgi:transglutaminase-like putative cysteine protease